MVSVLIRGHESENLHLDEREECVRLERFTFSHSALHAPPHPEKRLVLPGHLCALRPGTAEGGNEDR